MEDRKKLIIGVMMISVFVFIVGLSSLYVQIQIETGNVCGCLIPITLFIPFLAAVGLFIGTMVYYFFSPGMEPKKIDKNIILNVFDPDERVIMDFLLKNRGESMQARIVNGTDLSKVKVFRVLDRLVKKGIISKDPHGKTNRVMLNEELKNSIK
ncbi:hypothetical protein KA005_59680 [bacterium]|nr:hypothetical protein [bacterium]